MACLVAFSMDSIRERTESWLAPLSLRFTPVNCLRDWTFKSFSTLLITLSVVVKVKLDLGKVGDDVMSLA